MESLTIDRINTYGNYEPSNCRWTTQVVQACNKKKKNKYIGLIKKNNKYECYITFNNKRLFLGSFITEIEGAIARDKYIIENNLPHTLNGVISGKTGSTIN